MSSSNTTSLRKEHEPTQEEDDKLFVATGFRFLPAYERGFPFPWCAKRGNKGWLIRPSPPTCRREESAGEEIKGWKAAWKMIQSRDILMKRVQNKEQQGLHQSLAAGGNPEFSMQRAIMNKGGSKKESKPLKKRTFIPPNNDTPRKIISPKDVLARNAVDQWFRNTPRAVQTQQIQAKEEEFQRFLSKRKKQYASEIKQILKKKKEEQRKKKELQCKALEEPHPASIHQTPTASTLPMSPIRKKHKKTTPKRAMSCSPSSIKLGEDPQLDQMIEDIVLEFTNEFSRGQDSEATGDAGGVEFDGRAVSVLREAARETLNGMAQQNSDGFVVQDLDTKLSPQKRAIDAENCVAKGAKDSSETTTDSYKTTGDTPNEKGTQQIKQQQKDEDVTEKRITNMIEQLIGEVEHDSGCQFDGRAREALREAAKEIVTKDDGSNDSSNVFDKEK